MNFQEENVFRDPERLMSSLECFIRTAIKEVVGGLGLGHGSRCSQYGINEIFDLRNVVEVRRKLFCSIYTSQVDNNFKCLAYGERVLLNLLNLTKLDRSCEECTFLDFRAKIRS